LSSSLNFIKNIIVCIPVPKVFMTSNSLSLTYLALKPSILLLIYSFKPSLVLLQFKFYFYFISISFVLFIASVCLSLSTSAWLLFTALYLISPGNNLNHPIFFLFYYYDPPPSSFFVKLSCRLDNLIFFKNNF